ncbi:hypothetical protein PISL3812_08347 [Talaromyces islandicus]|uniref:Uncharacterized protein n=1 Tax=Talaromyces islandicus TaxID=28573 RepID=A0A0U1M6V8_TALIS|nr:hypothetical protein PISL3812_08347 [Talaromyces islandicus]
METTSQNQQAILELSQKLNALQPQRYVLYDEQCTAEWRGLRQKFENWVSKSFENAAILNTMSSDLLISKGLYKVPPEKYLETSAHTRRAYIQSYISHFIFDEILSVWFVQVPDVQVSQALHTMAQHMKSKGDWQLWEQWSSSTSTALECFSNSGFLPGKLDNLLHTVDFHFGEFYNNNMSRKLVHDKLSEVFWDCVGFKAKLERGESDYQLECSDRGKLYSEENMNSTSLETREGAVVQLSLWPSISKTSLNAERLILEHEAVWTSAQGATQQDAEADLRGKDSLSQKEQQLDVDMEDDDTETEGWIL